MDAMDLSKASRGLDLGLKKVASIGEVWTLVEKRGFHG